MAYDVIITSKQALAYDNTVMTAEGTRFFITKDDEGMPSSCPIKGEVRHPLPERLYTFESKEAAERFAKRWKGHPWWCRPNGTFEIIDVEPVYKQVVIGYKVATKPVSPD